MPDPMNPCTYSPQIAPGNNRMDAVPANMRPIVPRGTIRLKYPYDAADIDAFIVLLKAPNLRNKFLPKISRIQRESRGGQVIVFRDPVWTKMVVLNWAFEGLTATQAESCLEFSSESCGGIIELIDFESRTMRGIIMNPANPVSQERPDIPKPDCQVRGYTWKFDFQGVFV